MTSFSLKITDWKLEEERSSLGQKACFKGRSVGYSYFQGGFQQKIKEMSYKIGRER